MYFPDRGCIRPLRHLYGYATGHNNVYGAVIMTKVIARAHPVHLTNVD